MTRSWTLLRSIPAPAGEPSAKLVDSGASAVYPRACGGTGIPDTDAIEAKGLSPRLRGNRICSGLISPVGRSIPAPAGEPGSPRGQNGAGGVYPRACWGTRRRKPSAVRSSGSIPAPAGEPLAPFRIACETAVYPRACGGTRATQPNPIEEEGLSPRLRGNLVLGQRSISQRWVYPPAPAGEPGTIRRRHH